MFAEHISRSPRIASPWSARLSTSASTSASTTAPPTPPPPLGCRHPAHSNATANGKHQDEHQDEHQDHAHHPLPALHLLNMSCDDALSDISDEPDGFFSLDMDLSIDQQLPHHKPHPASAVRRASDTVVCSSSPLQRVGLHPVMASPSRNSPSLNLAQPANPAAHVDAHNASPVCVFGPIAPEVDQKGNLEYKLKILPPNTQRFDRLVTQLKWRLLEGGGVAVYEIGVLDDGTLIGLDTDSIKDSLKILSLMAVEVGASCHVQRVLALEHLAQSSDDAHAASSSTFSTQLHFGSSNSQAASQRLETAQSALSLRALPSHQAIRALQPYILTADIHEHVRAQLLESCAAALYRFDIAEQHHHHHQPANVAKHAADSADDVAMSAQTKRRLLKSTLNALDQSAVVYLPSKHQKRILRAAAEAQIQTEIQAAEAHERHMMAKMTRFADCVQPTTARARARARQSTQHTPADSVATTPSRSPSVSPEYLPATKPTNAAGASARLHTGYENVLSAFGVLSERAARTLYAQRADATDDAVKPRLIVEAVVRSDADSAHGSKLSSFLQRFAA